MQVLYIAAFIAILGIITIIPTDIGRKIIRKTESFVARPTSTLTPTSLPTHVPTTAAPTLRVSPTLTIKPIIRHGDEEDE